MAQVPLPDRVFSRATRSSLDAFYAPARKVALALPSDGRKVLVTVHGELGGEPTDL